MLLDDETLIIEGNIGGVIRAQLPSNGKFTWGSVRKLIVRCRQQPKVASLTESNYVWPHSETKR
ncbi:MAG: hypothetical protein ACTS7I_00555 [Candidatus Hodgkinia cicadicola]